MFIFECAVSTHEGQFVLRKLRIAGELEIVNAHSRAKHQEEQIIVGTYSCLQVRALNDSLLREYSRQQQKINKISN